LNQQRAVARGRGGMQCREHVESPTHPDPRLCHLLFLRRVMNALVLVVVFRLRNCRPAANTWRLKSSSACLVAAGVSVRTSCFSECVLICPAHRVTLIGSHCASVSRKSHVCVSSTQTPLVLMSLQFTHWGVVNCEFGVLRFGTSIRLALLPNSSKLIATEF